MMKTAQDHSRRRSILKGTLLVALATGALIPAAEAVKKKNVDDGEYLSPPEIIKLAERSKTKYTIGMLSSLKDVNADHLEDVLWPPGPEPPRSPWVASGAEESRRVQPYAFDEGCLASLAETEPLFKSEEYAAALEKYLAAATQYPGCYLALSHVGDGYYFTGRFADAIPWYDKAIAANPYDHYTYFFKGNALFRLGKPEEARACYAQSLALSPRSAALTKVLTDRADDLGAEFVARPFTPRVLARPAPDGGVAVYCPSDLKAHWLTYGMCKAIWIGEPEHRKARLGTTEHDWTSKEEVQCLFSLLESYVAQRESKAAPEDPEMERLLEVMDAGMLDELVVYEMGSRVAPAAMLTLSADDRARIEEFVKRFILRPKDTRNEATPPSRP